MKKMIFSGFGGQGILTLGQIVASIVMKKGKEVTWMPSYGPEMRGGTANCSLIVSDSKIGSPFVPDALDVLIAMNVFSVMKFESRVKPGGLMIVNTSIVTEQFMPTRTDIKIVGIDATNIANTVGSPKVQNMVMLAGFLKELDMFTMDDIKNIVKEIFGETKAALVETNIKAVEAGYESIA